MLSRRTTDTRDELHVYRFANGVKLIRPNKLKSQNASLLHDTKHTVNSILELPLSVYFIRVDYINEKVNEYDASACGLIQLEMRLEKPVLVNLQKNLQKLQHKMIEQRCTIKKLKFLKKMLF